jgi:Tfp pilus assembly protein PilX
MKALWRTTERERGAVALFVVVFATLLMIVITLSFVQLMLKDQRQATASDLSQSAYDSAKSGVEDAKRLLLLDQSCRSGTAPGGVNCAIIKKAIDDGKCNTIAAVFGNPNDSETVVQQNAGDDALQQAYTCVKIVPNTDDYTAVLKLDESNIVPLKGVGSFNSVRISWFTHDDVSTAAASQTVRFPTNGPNVSLPQTPKWDVDMPSLLRAQLLQVGPNFKLDDFNDAQPGNKSNNNTLFLYPSASGVDTLDFALDTPRRSASAAPQQVRCNPSFIVSEYACTVTLNLPVPLTGNETQRNAFLHLGALYNGARYKIELLNNGSVVAFDHVQPKVDSTGRANNMFRRVESRVEFKTDFAYPQAAIDLKGDLCKNFVITDKDPGPTDSFGYPTATCTP